MKTRGKYDTYYGIFEVKKHDIDSSESKPELARGWFDTPEEAQQCLDEFYNGGEWKRYDNDFYGWHYSYHYVIYAMNDGYGKNRFYDMDDYVRDMLKSGDWDKLSAEQKSMIASVSPVHTKFRLLLEGKMKLEVSEDEND